MYPHQLADVTVGYFKVTPYEYYCDMLVEVIRSERAYDALPNWTAADCNRVLSHLLFSCQPSWCRPPGGAGDWAE